jgi:hypothetical protein
MADCQAQPLRRVRGPGHHPTACRNGLHPPQGRMANFIMEPMKTRLQRGLFPPPPTVGEFVGTLGRQSHQMAAIGVPGNLYVSE